MQTQSTHCEPTSHGRDLACGGFSILIWIVPTILLVAAVAMGGVYPVIAWPVLLVFMGGACVLNARRCGRLHCFITGPFFLLLAAMALLYGLGILPLGQHGWQWLVDVLLIGGCVLTCVPEWLFGRYIRHS
ncbi:MAG: hypothetical protein KGJ56_07610 [Gammaproteobacteria bacterium]|nr:hypothetical protein [Gammaproteobacteria bacterium]